MKNNTDLKRKNSLIFNIANVPSQIVPSSNIISLGLNIVNTFNNSDRSIFIILSSLYECQTLYDILLEYIDKNKVCLFVNDEIVSSNTLTQSKEFDIECVNTMYKLSFGKEKIITITNVTGYMTLLCDKQTFQSRILNLKKGLQISRNTIEKMLQTSGYTKVRDVYASSEYAIRGMIVDIYSPNYNDPIRIELFDDEIEDIRFFNPNNSLSYEYLDEVTILPCTYRLLNNKNKEIGIQILKEKTSSNNINNSFIKDDFFLLLEENCTNLYLNSNLSRYFPYFNATATNIFSYADSSCFDFFVYDFEKIVDQIYFFTQEERNFYHNYQQIKSLDLDGIYIKDEDAISKLDVFKKIQSTLDERCKIVNPTIVGQGIDESIGVINSYLIDNNNVFIFVSKYQKENIENYFNVHNFKYNSVSNYEEIQSLLQKQKHGNVFTIDCELANSFYDLNKKAVVLTSYDIYGRGIKKSNFLSRFKQAKVIKKYDELLFGDYVVHEKYGIGQYLGVEKIDNLEYLKIQYAKQQKLYVPLNQFRYIRKYASRDGYVPALDSMDGTSWAQRKIKIRNKISYMADQLLSLYAKRVSTPGFAFETDKDLEAEFSSKFPYELTYSQINAIKDINNDMSKPYPMDRLIIGDVGFGKTEVAFQAAYKAILNNKQVCFLCPTTILAKQHYDVAVKRFAQTNIVIKLVNRFVSTKEMNQIVTLLKQHKIDMVIGTHKLLSNSIKFDDLGLLIVDEEQRFGVTHKEKIKAISSNVDCLTLSATPIPRTLQMSLVNLKSISMLTDPPLNRIPIRTYVSQKNDELIKEAIQRELGRNGQVYYLFNDIMRMREIYEKLVKMFPKANIMMLHGQMDGDYIDEVMTKFYNNEIDILICTTIIESGLDVPNANTIIVEKSDNFGLSQLYQIKGRVGRFDKMAYCYLLYDNYNNMTEDGKKRLIAMKSFVELGSGYKIASTDLKIRGAGDLLGKMQSGHIDSIGYETFNKLVKEVMEKQNEQNESIKLTKNDSSSLYSTLYNDKGNTYYLSFSLDARIPDEYCCQEDRISLYRELSNIDSLDELSNFSIKIKDVFGNYPSEVNNLLNKRKIEIILNMGFVESFVETLSSYKITLTEQYSFIKGIYDELLEKLSCLVDCIRMQISSRHITIYLNRTNEYLENLLYLTTTLLECSNYKINNKNNDELVDNIE